MPNLSDHPRNPSREYSPAFQALLSARPYPVDRPVFDHTTEHRTQRLNRAFARTFQDRLPWCTTTSRCCLWSCPSCRVELRDLFAAETEEAMIKHGPLTAWEAVTIVPGFGRTKIGALPVGGLRAFKAKVQRKIRNVASEAIGYFCIDVSWERRLNGEEHWQWHVHGTMRGLNETMRKKIRASFKLGERSADKPVQFKRITRDDTGGLMVAGLLEYAAKANFLLREPRNEHCSSYRTSGPQERSLNYDQEIELMKVLCNFKTKQRIFRIG